MPRPAGPKLVPLYLRVPPELVERIRAIAKREERPLNAQATRFLRVGLSQYDLEQSLKDTPNESKTS